MNVLSSSNVLALDHNFLSGFSLFYRFIIWYRWPDKLDVTKRADFKCVKSSFLATPPNQVSLIPFLPSNGSELSFPSFLYSLRNMTYFCQVQELTDA